MADKYEDGSMFSRVHPLADEDHDETFTGYTLSRNKIGSSTSPFTEMQIAEVEKKLREGMTAVEAGTLDPTKFESIPTEHFRDMRRLAKLAGAEITIHTPMIDPAGFREGRWGGKEARESAERQFKGVIAKGMEANPQGNVPIVIHAGGDGSTPANIWERGSKGEFKQKAIYAINQLDGSIEPIIKEKVYDPREGREVTEWPTELLKKKNEKSWMEILNQVQESMAKRNEIFRELKVHDEIFKDLVEGKKKKSELGYEERRIFNNAPENKRRFDMYNSLLSENVQAIAKISLKFGGEEGRKIAQKISEVYYRNKGNELGDSAGEALGILIEASVKKKGGFCPELLMPVDKFAKGHVAETFSELAVWARDYAKEKGYKAPIIVAENVFPHTSFSTADSMKELIDKTRKETQEKLMAKGLGKDEAKEEAEKLIGVTWDVGHINNFKKFGFKDEDIIKETKKIAKYVKHLHVHDNLGSEPSHLPVGMGNVPLKKILKVLEDEGYNGKAILEGGAATQFGTSDFSYSMKSLNQPMYPSAISASGGMGWDSMPQTQSYFSGYGNILPDQHFAMYGAGFSQLPTELGGRAGSRGSRFAGTPTE